MVKVLLCHWRQFRILLIEYLRVSLLRSVEIFDGSHYIIASDCIENMVLIFLSVYRLVVLQNWSKSRVKQLLRFFKFIFFSFTPFITSFLSSKSFFTFFKNRCALTISTPCRWLFRRHLRLILFDMFCPCRWLLGSLDVICLLRTGRSVTLHVVGTWLLAVESIVLYDMASVLLCSHLFIYSLLNKYIW